MVLRRLSNGKLIQIDLSHDEQGRRYARVYGVGFKLKEATIEYKEAMELAELYADIVEIIAE